jgi:DNA-binding transcriptional ArsR family regulator
VTNGTNFPNVVGVFSISETVLLKSHIEGQCVDPSGHRTACLAARSQPEGAAALPRARIQQIELAAPFEMTQPAVSRHLKVLEGAGLIIRRVEGTKRPCRLAPAAIDEIDQWLGMLRQALAKNYDWLDDVLAGMQRTKRKGKR